MSNQLVFPSTVDFEHIGIMQSIYSSYKHMNHVHCDLSLTRNAHISLIGLLIHAKNEIESIGGRISLSLSGEMYNLMTTVNIVDHFADNIIEA